MSTPRMTGPDGGRALVPYHKPPARTPAGRFGYGQLVLVVTAIVAMFGLGAAGTHAAQLAWSHYNAARTAQVAATERTLRRLEDELGRLKNSVDTLRATAQATQGDDTLRALRQAVDAMKSDIQQVRASDGTSLQQIAAKLDRTDRDAGPKLAEIAARLDKIEHDPAPKPAADPALPKIADLSSRLDRIEHQAAASAGALPRPAVAAANVTTIGRTVPAARTATANRDTAEAPRAPALAAWALRDVYDGLALVEGPRGGLREVGPGEYLPGAGRIRSIERRGRAWVVLTNRGVIE